VIWHRFKSMLMILCIVLTVLLPIALAILVASFNRQIVARAASTPLVAGAPGSRIDLTMHALYFTGGAPGRIPLGQKEEVGELGLAIPIHAGITASHVPVVGTSLDYFEFRQMSIETGNGLARLGDCVLGCNAAQRLGRGPGDSLLTDRENLFEIAGNYPLKMRVRGILSPTGTPDDDVVFVDIKTCWVVEGLGHGHQDLEHETDETLVLERDAGSVTASAAVLPYTEITDENIGSFHFHGSFSDFPVTALIVVPVDDRGATILLGRFNRNDSPAQMCQPLTVVEELMGLIFRVQQFFNANAVLIAVSTVLLLGLVVALSIRLRQAEMETMFKIGCSRGTMASLIIAELAIVFACAAVIAGVLAWVISQYAGSLVAGLV
jgi:putative ABC transport system permease protein